MHCLQRVGQVYQMDRGAEGGSESGVREGGFRAGARITGTRRKKGKRSLAFWYDDCDGR